MWTEVRNTVSDTVSLLPRTAIGRTLIPRYFRSIFEGGVTELYFSLRHPKESFHNTSITLDCDQACMVTHHGKPMIAKVSAGRRGMEARGGGERAAV